MNTKKLLGFALMAGLPLLIQAQQEQATGLRASGKIYVVIGVILIILFGLIGYLTSLDRKINRMERRLHEQNPREKS